MKPLVTVIVTAYNRSNTILRTMNSIITQTWENIDIVVVDDGSTDHTLKIVEQIGDPRIRIIRHPSNLGVTAAKNTGLNNIRGEWFVFVDSDDEILPHAIETLIRIPLEFDSSITAIDSGAFDTESGCFSEKCFLADQYVDEGTIVNKCCGDVWGMTKTSLIGKDRLNVYLPGWENTLWYKVNAKAKRYYIHQKLRIYHTEGEDRISKKQFDLDTKSKTFKHLLEEEFYLERVKKYNSKKFIKYCLRGSLYLSATGDKKNSRNWSRRLKEMNSLLYSVTQMASVMPDAMVKKVVEVTQL